jgi:uncharacterized protein (TIRG00374 family)
MKKNQILALLKWTFAIGILVLLLKSGKISLNELAVFLKKPQNAVLCFLILLANYLLCFYRWRLLLSAVGLKIQYKMAVKLGMLGQFFSSIIPGTVGGDLVKAVYITKKFSNKKTAALSSIVLDRVVGLLAIIILSGVSYIAGYQIVHSQTHPLIPLIEALGMSLALGAVSILLALSALSLWGKKLPNQLPKKYENRFWYPKVEALLEIIVCYKNDTRALWQTLSLSLFVHALNMLCFWVIAVTIYGPGPWGLLKLSTFVMSAILGMIAMAIPVAPMGLGVGQVAFAAIFRIQLALGCVN